MELQELVNKIESIFEIGGISDLKERLYETVIKNDFEKYKKYLEDIGELDIDNLQNIFQYYFSDREKKKQDFTPKSLCSLISDMIELDEKENEIIDMCAGSGALTINFLSKHKKYLQKIKVISYELDEKAIPFLLFNLAVRNVTGKVYQSDILRNIIFNSWELKSGNEFSTVQEVKNEKNSII